MVGLRAKSGIIELLILNSGEWSNGERLMININCPGIKIGAFFRREIFIVEMYTVFCTVIIVVNLLFSSCTISLKRILQFITFSSVIYYFFFKKKCGNNRLIILVSFGDINLGM